MIPKNITEWGTILLPISFLLYVAIGYILATANIFINNWQFWALLMVTMSIDLVSFIACKNKMNKEIKDLFYNKITNEWYNNTTDLSFNDYLLEDKKKWVEIVKALNEK